MASRSYAAVLTQLAAEEPDRVAVVCEDAQITRGELAADSNRLARQMIARGVAAGDRVTIHLPNGIEFVRACLAIWKCGAVPTPISPRLPVREQHAVLDLAAPALAVGLEPGSASCEVLPPGHAPDPTLDDSPLPDATSPSERAIASGGSTGRPKLILLQAPATHDPELPATVLAPRGCVLVPGPLYHAAPFGSLTQALLAGEKVVLMKRFDASECLALVERHGVDQILFVPTMMQRIWRLPEAERTSRDISSLRIVFTGGAPCPAWLMRAWIEWLGPDVMHELYGGTERLGGTMISGREWLEHPGSVGRPTRGSGIRILDVETGEEVPPGEVGEIYMMPRGGQGSTYRYLGAEARATGDGWESVGDLGSLDEDGYLYIADRRTDMILCGGRNVYPAQLEAAIDEHPAVSSSAVIGLPDEDMGQRVHAIVQRAGAVDEAALRKHLEDRVVHYALPRSFEWVDFPLRDEAGKLRRWALREERINASAVESEPTS